MSVCASRIDSSRVSFKYQGTLQRLYFLDNVRAQDGVIFYLAYRATSFKFLPELLKRPHVAHPDFETLNARTLQNSDDSSGARFLKSRSGNDDNNHKTWNIPSLLML
jgi:hypothetical protein